MEGGLLPPGQDMFVEGYMLSTPATLAVMTHWCVEMGGHNGAVEKSSAREFMKNELSVRCAKGFTLNLLTPGRSLSW